MFLAGWYTLVFEEIPRSFALLEKHPEPSEVAVGGCLLVWVGLIWSGPVWSGLIFEASDFQSAAECVLEMARVPWVEKY